MSFDSRRLERLEMPASVRSSTESSAVATPTHVWPDGFSKRHSFMGSRRSGRTKLGICPSQINLRTINPMNENEISAPVSEEIYRIQTKAKGPAGSLPITEEMLRNQPSGDLFGLT